MLVRGWAVSFQLLKRDSHRDSYLLLVCAKWGEVSTNFPLVEFSFSKANAGFI
jgi:hypothetical protein